MDDNFAGYISSNISGNYSPPPSPSKMGWECPKCGRCYNPTVTVCPDCRKTIFWRDITTFPPPWGAVPYNDGGTGSLMQDPTTYGQITCTQGCGNAVGSNYEWVKNLFTGGKRSGKSLDNPTEKV